MQIREKTVLVLGAGLVARPCVEYLSREHQVNLVSGVDGEANALVSSLPQERQALVSAATIDVQADIAMVEDMVRSADLTISLLPAPMHPQIARLCLAHGKDMVTASYVSPEMLELDDKFKEAGLVCLNEVGVDPGMDHMSAQKVIHEVEHKGGKVMSFSSLCGGLPAPEAANNPLK
jgi:alpha-aminoadipic semialdehyde synthase